MSEDDCRAVRPRWICGTVGEGVEQENGGWEEYATRLKRAVKAKGEGPREEKEEEIEEKEEKKKKNTVRERPSACLTQNSQVPKKYGNTT